MGKRNYSWTEDKIAKFIKEGRGSGELSNYKPWLTIHDVPSEGNASRLKGWKTGRIHHLLSNIERSYFFMLEWSESVLDIREQFPLERLDTLEIARDKGIPHIKDNATGTYIPLTTDFLITIKKNDKIITIASSIKPFKELEDIDTLKKLEVEREYWNQKAIDWQIVTEKDIPKAFSENIRLIHNFKTIESVEEESIALRFLGYLDRLKDQDILSVYDCIVKFEEDYIFKPGETVNYFKYLLANKFVSINMEKKLNLRSLNVQDLSIHYKESEGKIGRASS